MKEYRVVLRNVQEAGDIRYLGAILTGDGELKIEGQDVGDDVEEIFGYREYEWVWTIRSEDVAALLKALGKSSDPLSALEAQFSGEDAGKLKAFLDTNEIPHEAWSRVGD